MTDDERGLIRLEDELERSGPRAPLSLAISIDFSSLLSSLGSAPLAASHIQQCAATITRSSTMLSPLLFMQYLLLPAQSGPLSQSTENDLVQVLDDTLGEGTWGAARCDFARSDSKWADAWAALVVARLGRKVKGGVSSARTLLNEDVPSLPFLAVPPPVPNNFKHANGVVSPERLIRELHSVGMTDVVVVDFVGYNVRATSPDGLMMGYGLQERLAQNAMFNEPLLRLADPLERVKLWGVRATHQTFLAREIARLLEHARAAGGVGVPMSACCGVGSDGITILCRDDRVDRVVAAVQGALSTYLPAAVVSHGLTSDLAADLAQCERCLAAMKCEMVAAATPVSVRVPCMACQDLRPTGGYGQRQRSKFESCDFAIPPR